MDPAAGCPTRTSTGRCTARVFVDTSAWYALIDRRDALHARAAAEVGRLLAARTRLVTSDYVVDESCTLTRMRAGSEAAVRLLGLLHRSEWLDWEWIDAERFGRAESWFRRFRDQDYSFTDCASFALMRELRLDTALTSDRHFKAAGFRALLG